MGGGGVFHKRWRRSSAICNLQTSKPAPPLRAHSSSSLSTVSSYNKIFRFLALPSEIRNRIYEFAWQAERMGKPGEAKEDLCWSVSGIRRARVRQYTLLFVNRQIHREALPVAYRCCYLAIVAPTVHEVPRYIEHINSYPFFMEFVEQVDIQVPTYWQKYGLLTQNLSRMSISPVHTKEQNWKGLADMLAMLRKVKTVSVIVELWGVTKRLHGCEGGLERILSFYDIDGVELQFRFCDGFPEIIVDCVDGEKEARREWEEAWTRVHERHGKSNLEKKMIWSLY